MTLTINSGYKEHLTARKFLASKNIKLNVIESNSPYILATIDNPNIVIHPMSKIMDDEYPSIKFCGPDCKFPNYNFNLINGFTDLGLNKIPSKKIENEIILINTINDTPLVKYLESLNLKLSIYGEPCSSLYYYGKTEVDSYILYKNSAIIGVDNETELLKALSVIKSNNFYQRIISIIDNNYCFNFKNKNQIQKNENLDLYLESKNWNNIFSNFLNEIGVKYE